ncbi:phosphatidate cytidylyltransferase [Stomatobaculum longum]|jgi:cytidylyltransferase family|uniref:phosphatidate cytidylyltransferase n=1 Tax=Stomatobaculum longum TaxID=796942 RepID=UPI0028DBE69E|nr:phosphatidate cytidylyltransferase [Stomatobaculum longum]
MSRLLNILGSRKFHLRLLSGIVLVLLAFLALRRGGMVLYCSMMAISLIGQYELYRVVKTEREPLGIVGYLSSIAYYLLLLARHYDYGMPLMIGTLMALMALFVLSYPRYRTEQIAVGLMGVLYTTVMFSYVYRVRSMPHGAYLVWLIFISSWGCDTCAYVVGMLAGSHHFAPVLSPKKTVEGAIGGVAGAALLGLAFGFFLRAELAELGNPGFACLFACAFSAVISQIGDLAASAIKRDHEVKDYGDLIPGHGGILDRFDSLLFTAPAIFFALFLYSYFVRH